MTPNPDLANIEYVTATLKENYGLEAIDIKPLNGYDYLNFHVRINPANFNNSYIDRTSNHGYVLKIVNEKDSKNSSLMDGRILMVEHLNSKSLKLKVSRAIKTINGDMWFRDDIPFLQNQKGEVVTRIVCLLEYIPGKIWNTVVLSKSNLRELGETIGSFNLYLKDFINKGIEDRHLIWNLSAFPEIADLASVVKEPKKINLINQVSEAWNKNVEPSLAFLEKGIIHGDFNAYNIIISRNLDQKSKENIVPETENYRIYGIIDFGDVCYSPYIFDLVISLTYIMLDITSMDMIKAGAHIVSGYQSKRLITATEWNILKECIMARLTQSLVLGAVAYAKDPTNEYVLKTSRKGWIMLQRLCEFPKEEFLEALKMES